MPKRRIVWKHIELDSDAGQRMGQVDSLAQEILWPFLSTAIRIDHVLFWIIAMYFVPDEKRRAEFYSLVLHKEPPALGFRHKIQVVKGILDASYREPLEPKRKLIKQLDDIRQFRNKIAHWEVDRSEEAMARVQANEIRLVPYEGSKRDPEVLTKEEANAKAQQWVEVFHELTQVGNVVIERSSETATQVKESGKSNE